MFLSEVEFSRYIIINLDRPQEENTRRIGTRGRGMDCLIIRLTTIVRAYQITVLVDNKKMVHRE